MSNKKYNKIKKDAVITSIKELKHAISIKLGFHDKQIKKIEKKIVELNLSPNTSSITENIAFVLNGKIVEIIHCQPYLAEILLGKPEIVNIPKKTFPKIGWFYIDGEFKENK